LLSSFGIPIHFRPDAWAILAYCALIVAAAFSVTQIARDGGRHNAMLDVHLR